MPTTTQQFTEAQSWIGTAESQATFDERFDRLGSLNDAIHESMRAQLASLLGDPARITTPDGVTVDNSANITALQQQIKRFLALGGLPDQPPAPRQGTSIIKVSRSRGRGCGGSWFGGR